MEDFETNQTEPDTAVDPEPAAPFSQRLILFMVAGSVLLLDQFSKNLVEQTLNMYQVFAPFPEFEGVFRIIHATNTGMALGLFPDGSLFFGVMAVIVSSVIIIYNHTMPRGNVWLRLALGLTLGGALGNLIDRIRLGHVTDFLDFGPVPIFNVADAAVVCGALLLGLLMLVDARREKRAAAAETLAATEFETSSNNLTEESSSIN